MTHNMIQYSTQKNRKTILNSYPILTTMEMIFTTKIFSTYFIIFFSSLFSMLTTQRLMICLAFPFPFPFPQKIDEPNRGLVILSKDGQSWIILQVDKIIPKHDFTKEEK